MAIQCDILHFLEEVIVICIDINWLFVFFSAVRHMMVNIEVLLIYCYRFDFSARFSNFSAMGFLYLHVSSFKNFFLNATHRDWQILQ